MDEKPNVILLTIDSLRADHVSCLGYPGKTTPNMDDLAKKGALFSQAISNGGNTASSFPSILTSSYPRMHLSEEELRPPYRWIFLSETRSTLAEVLKANGYQTAAFHSNPVVSSFFHYDRGFDIFDDQMGKWFVRSEIFRDVGVANRILDKLRRGHALCGVLQGRKGNTERASVIHGKAISWLKNRSDSFFLWLHYMDVHEPYIPVESTFFERAKAVRLYRKSKAQASLPKQDLGNLVDFYDREVEYVDREIGSFLGEVGRMDISLSNTYFILTADHGEQLMDHGIVGHGYLYDELIHIPLIILGPGIEENGLIEGQVHLLDLAPTILDLLGIPRVESFQGTSLVPVIRGDMDRREGVISEGNSFVHLGKLASRFCYRTEEWKYILLLDENREQIEAELYDLQNDPKERENAVEKERKVAEELKAKLLDHIAMERQERLKALGMKERAKLEYDEKERKEIERRLRSLGYM